jgi:outer membrane protein OmpA-like peptidoglycan-associated protein
MALAHDRVAAGSSEEAAGFLNRAIEACPSYEAYESLAELQAQSAEQADQKQAVDAFVTANDLAPNAQARAKTEFEYAKLLARNGEQQKAYPIAMTAHVLDRQNAQIGALARQLQEQIEHPTQNQLVRGFMEDALYKPLHVAAEPASSRGRPPAADTNSEPGHESAVHGTSIIFPINFNTASTDVDQRTWPNIATLAHAMADPKLAGHRFVFIGHADRRGEDQYNMELSRRRAEAMYQDVILVEPSLRGRVDTDGRGSHEPLDPGTSEEALRTNRRLQVLLK